MSLSWAAPIDSWHELADVYRLMSTHLIHDATGLAYGLPRREMSHKTSLKIKLKR